MLAIATLSPWQWVSAGAEVSIAFERALAPELNLRDAVDAVRNLLLFFGWGVVWMISLRRRWQPADLIKAAASGLLLGLAIESLQLLNQLRHANLLDVLTNTLGAFLGAAALFGYRRWLGQRTAASALLISLGAAYLAAVGLDILLPSWRLAVIDTAWGPPLRRLQVVLATPAPQAVWPLASLILYAPAGFLLGWLLQAPNRPPWLLALLSGLIIGLLEITHPLLGYPIQAGPALTHWLALTLGIGLAWLWARQALPIKFSGTWLSLAYGLLLAAWILRPYEWQWPWTAGQSSVDWGRLVPLAGHKWRSDIFSAVDILQNALLFFPLGLMLGHRPWVHRGPFAAAWPAVYVALVLELAQVFIAGRYPDGTDVLVAGAAAALAYRLWVISGQHRAEIPSTEPDPVPTN